MTLAIPALNFHLYKPCNARCRFCFATFRDVRGHLPLDEARRLIDVLRAGGGEKLNFAGGEPTLHPHIGALVEHAKAVGFVTSIVTNGAKLERLLDRHAAALDWVAFSIDSGREAVEVALGRSRVGEEYVAKCVSLAARVRAEGIRVKLNTVVTALSWREDMSALVRAMRPERWKVFQVLPVEGQNDGDVEPLLVTPGQFEAFTARHAHLAVEGYRLVAEDNDAMTDSYAMIDPLGRFYGDTDGRHRTSAPILEVGVDAALREVGYEPERLERRGGLYDWAASMGDALAATA